MSTTTTPTTLNQIVENLRDIAANHYQIHTFYYGDPHEFYLSGTTNSPEMWVACDSVDRDAKGGLTTFNFNIVIADNVKRGEVNELEVESDIQQICEDVLAQLQHHDYKWNVTTSSKITIRTEKTPKNLTTAEFQVAIRVPKPNNRCAIPFSTSPLTNATDGSPVVSLINAQTNAVITTIPCGGSYSVYQFDTINGGSASTVFTDIIVAI